MLFAIAFFTLETERVEIKAKLAIKLSEKFKY